MPVEKIPSWIERLLMPKLSSIDGKLEAINTRMDALESKMDTKIDSLDERMNTRINSLDEKIDSLRNEMKSEFKSIDYRFDSLEKRIPVIEEITALKLKIAELEKKMAMA